MREARIHVRHVRDLLKSVEPADAYNGVDCASLSFLNTVTGVIVHFYPVQMELTGRPSVNTFHIVLLIFWFIDTLYNYLVIVKLVLRVGSFQILC